MANYKPRPVLEFLLTPIRFTLPHKTLNRLGVRSLMDERIDMVLSRAHGRVLDIGCGENRLIKQCPESSVGVDVYDFGGRALIVDDTRNLPFTDGEFDTVTMVACFNHVPEPHRLDVLAEAKRVLNQDGRLLITMISPFIGLMRHKVAWWDRDQRERGMTEGEAYGLSSEYVTKLAQKSGFQFVEQINFLYNLNRLYVFESKN